MSFDPDAVETVTFDSYSTLVDVDAAERALADRVADPEPISRHWRARSLMYTFVANAVDAYRPFYDVLRHALDHALATRGVDLDPDEREEILSIYHELDVFDDVRHGIERLREAGYDCYVLSNGDPEMLASMVDHAGIEGLIDDAISADEVATFKPNAELYRHAAARTDTPIEGIAHVTAGWFDVLGARHAGMQTVWLDRAGRPWDAFGAAPDLTVSSLDGVADALTA